MTIAIVRTALTATTLVVTAVGGASIATTLVGSTARAVPPTARIPAAAPAVPGPAAGALGPVDSQNRPASMATPRARHTPTSTPGPVVAPHVQIRSAAAGRPGVTTVRPSTSSSSTVYHPSSHDSSDDAGQRPSDDGTGHDD
ncbi:MAG: hypothetical protein JWQ32_137 [Marmoricola sp.]|nr:hypothetical protein [Marmoricola sp.]